MATTPDFLDSKRNEIAARIEQLRPAVAEYQRLEAAAAALEGVPTANGTGSGVIMAASGAPVAERVQKAAAVKQASGRKRGRPKGSGRRRAQALAIVRESPGITIPEIAERMGIRQNYLYRVLPALAEEGRIVKDGRGWKVTEIA